MATRLISVARRASAAERLATMPRLERASATLASAAKALVKAMDDGGAWLDVTAAWTAVEQVAPREDVLSAVAVIEELVPDDAAEDAAMREALTARYGVVRPFLELLAEALPRPGRSCWLRSGGCPTSPGGGSGQGTCAAMRSAPRWYPPRGSGLSTATRNFRQTGPTGTPTCCASWSSCTGRFAAATSSPIPRCGGLTRARSCSTARAGPGSAMRC
jgi:hypothetical protein